MKSKIHIALIVCIVFLQSAYGQLMPKGASDTGRHYIYDVGNIKPDSIPTINLDAVNIVAFKSQADWIEYYKCRARIEKVLPYVKVAKQLYTELEADKANEKRRDYRRDRKELEKEMRGRFEKELKDLTISQGEMLFKLINRETGNDAYDIIKEIKNPFTAWMCQMIGKRYGYNLKEEYDPKKEKLIELVIRQMGTAYNVNS